MRNMSWRLPTERIRAPARSLVVAALVLSLGPAGSALADPGAITALAVSPRDGLLWVGAAEGLFRSVDQGRTLMAVALPVTGRAVEITAVGRAPGAHATVYVATGGEGVFRSEDDGTSWVASNVGLGALDVRGLAVSPRDGRLYAQVPGKGLYRSVNGAQQWHRVDHGPMGTLHALTSVNMPSGMGGIYLYAATGEGLLRTPDCF
jgi:photosystem II stability/assembly factor-like uncharacterized protein